MRTATDQVVPPLRPESQQTIRRPTHDDLGGGECDSALSFEHHAGSTIHRWNITNLEMQMCHRSAADVALGKCPDQTRDNKDAAKRPIKQMELNYWLMYNKSLSE